MSQKPLTEFAILSLKAGIDVTGSTTEAVLFRSDIIGVLKQQEGMTSLRWGHQLENPSSAIMAIGDNSSIRMHIHTRKMVTLNHNQIGKITPSTKTSLIQHPTAPL
jgi:hypothetical protein